MHVRSKQALLTTTSLSSSLAYVNEKTPPQLGDIADGLATVVALRQRADQLEAVEVERAMRAGWTWSQVAEALGVTRQAVHQKHAKRVIAAGVDLRRRNV